MVNYNYRTEQHPKRKKHGGDEMEPFAKNLRWIRGARNAFGFSQKQMADALGISVSSYQKKEAGDIRFSDGEKVMVAKILGLSMDQVNQIFFGGELPNGNRDGRHGNEFPPFLP